MHTFVICLQKEPLHIIIFHTWGVPGGPREARKGRALFQPRAALRRPQVTSAQKTQRLYWWDHGPLGIPLQAAGMGRKVQTRVTWGPTTWTLTGQRQCHALLSQLLFIGEVTGNLLCHSQVNSVYDSSAGMWLISLSKSPTLSLPIVFCLWCIKFSLLLIHQPGERKVLSFLTQWNYNESYLREQNNSRLSPLAPPRLNQTPRSSLKLSSNKGQHLGNIITIIVTKMTRKKVLIFLGSLPRVKKKKKKYFHWVLALFSQCNQMEVLKERISENQARPCLGKPIWSP